MSAALRRRAGAGGGSGPRSRSIVIWALATLLCCAIGLAEVIDQFPIESPWGLATGPDGATWFTSVYANKIGRIDANGAVTEFPVPSVYPQGIAPGPDGNLWFTDGNGIGRMTPSGSVTRFSSPNGGHAITAGPDGNLWYTGGSGDVIGRITTSGVITEFPVPTPSGLPSGITAGPDGNLWFTEFAGNKIGRITTAGTVTEFDLPTANSSPVGIAAGPDGNLWFTESSGRTGGIGRITPAGHITEFPSGRSFGIVAGADGNLWAVGSRSLRRIDTSGAVTDFSIPATALYWDPFTSLGIAAAPDGAIWIAAVDQSQIVRFSLADSRTSQCLADETTLCLDNGRFRVTADWTAGDGSTGHGRGVSLTANSGYFWFFDAENVEQVVKVLDGCSSNGHHWVFAAGLTNVEVRTTVTDTYSGNTQRYANWQGTPFAPIQDTAAFSTCP